MGGHPVRWWPRAKDIRRENARGESITAAHEPRTEATDPTTSDAAPTDTTPRDAAPVDTTHVDAAPTGATHVDTTYVDDAASEEAPTDTDARRRRPGRAGRRPVVGRLLSALLL